jgi:DNA polymerase-3 subunit beta
MDVLVDRRAFANETGWVGSSLSPNPPELIHNSVLLTAAGKYLTISGSDGSMSSQSWLDADGAVEGRAVVPRKLLAAVASTLPGDEKVRLLLDGSRLQVSCGRSTFRLPTAPADSYPALPEQPRTVGQISSEALVEAAGQVGSACATSDSMPVLTGVLILFGDVLTMVATNKFRLAKKDVPWIPVRGTEGRAVVPRKPLARVLRNVPPGPVSLALDEAGSVFGITAGHRRSVLPVLAGEFPDYQRLLALSFAATAEFETGDLVRALDRLGLVANSPEVPLRISFDDSEALLSAGESDALAAEAVACKVEGDAAGTAFDLALLQRAVASLRGEHCLMRLGAHGRPVQLSGSDEDAHIQLVVPLVK